MPCFKLYFCRKLQTCKSSILARELFICNIVIAMIYAESGLYSSVFSTLACNFFRICGINMTILVRRLPWLSSSSPSLSSGSSEICYSSSVSYTPSESSNRSSSEFSSAPLKTVSCSSSV